MSAVDWREEALIARAALYLLKVATARPDLPRLDAWIRERAAVLAVMSDGCGTISHMCDDQWIDLDWRRDTLMIMTDHDASPGLPVPPHWQVFRARVLALLDGP